MASPRKPKRPAKPPEEWLGAATGAMAAKRINAAERRLQAVEMRKRGETWEKIAEVCGYKNRGAASGDINKYIKELPQENAQNLRKIEIERLDQLLNAMWDKAMKGDGWAVDRCVKIMERKAKLTGIDAPVVTKVEIVPEETLDRQIAQLERQMAQLPRSQSEALRVQAERADYEARLDDAIDAELGD